jgi:hypothetical protein
MNKWRVRLTQTEMMVAAYVGSGRNVQCLTRGYTPVAGMGLDDTWTPNIEGSMGEIATAKALGIYYEPIIGNFQANDVGPYQVRTNKSRRWEDTCLRPRDKPNRIYIGVLSFCPDFELIGWIYGPLGKRDEYLRPGDPDRPPCFYVPREKLEPMDELPSIESAIAFNANNEAAIEEMMAFAREVLK